MKCGSPCDWGQFGYDCNNRCNCLNNASCSQDKGICECVAGWAGEHCEHICEEGTYGLGCKELCPRKSHGECLSEIASQVDTISEVVVLA